MINHLGQTNYKLLHSFTDTRRYLTCVLSWPILYRIWKAIQLSMELSAPVLLDSFAVLSL